MADDQILNIRMPREMRAQIDRLAAELKLPPSTTARLLLRRALDEPIGIAVVKEKVMQIHALMRARESRITASLRDMLLEMVDEVAPAVEEALPSPDVESQYLEDFVPEQTELPIAQPIVEDDDGDHGAGVVFSGRRRPAAVPGRRKRKGGS